MSPANPHRILPRSKKHRPIKPQMYRRVERRVEYSLGWDGLAPPDFWNALNVDPRSNARFRAINEVTMEAITSAFADIKLLLNDDSRGGKTLFLIRPHKQRTRLSKKLLSFLNLPH